MRASIYFNSLTSRIDETQLDYMMDDFEAYLGSEMFFDLDRYAELKFGRNPTLDGACDNKCPGRCHWSWYRGEFDETEGPRCKMEQLSE